jgi:hypothetical protein
MGKIVKKDNNLFKKFLTTSFWYLIIYNNLKYYFKLNF